MAAGRTTRASKRDQVKASSSSSSTLHRVLDTPSFKTADRRQSVTLGKKRAFDNANLMRQTDAQAQPVLADVEEHEVVVKKETTESDLLAILQEHATNSAANHRSIIAVQSAMLDELRETREALRVEREERARQQNALATLHQLVEGLYVRIANHETRQSQRQAIDMAAVLGKLDHHTAVSVARSKVDQALCENSLQNASRLTIIEKLATDIAKKMSRVGEAVDRLPSIHDMTEAVTEATRELPTHEDLKESLDEAIEDLATENDITQAINDAVNEAMNDTVNEAVHDAIGELPTTEDISQAINEAIEDLATEDGITQTINDAVNEAMSEAINDTVDKAVHDAISDLPTTDDISQTINEAISDLPRIDDISHQMTVVLAEDTKMATSEDLDKVLQIIHSNQRSWQ